MTLESFDNLIKDFKYPFLYLMVGDLNSRTTVHLDLNETQRNILLEQIKKTLLDCWIEKNEYCIDSLQKILVEYEEWYDYLKFNDVNGNDYFN